MLFYVLHQLHYVVLTCIFIMVQLQGMEPGQTLGHEFMGVVEEAGPEGT